MLLLFNTANLRSNQSNIQAIKVVPQFEQATKRLGQALRISTTTDSLEQSSSVQFRQWVKQRYPILFKNPNVRWQSFGQQSWVAKWIGRNSELAPVVLVASPFSKEPNLADIPRWTYNPLLGKIDDEFIYGLGSRSGKAVMIALLEVLEHYLVQDSLPDRTVYFAFPGENNNEKIALGEALKQADIRPEFILNTGGLICKKNTLLNLKRPVAMIGISHQSTYKIKLDGPANEGIQLLEQEINQVQKSLPHIDISHPVLQEFISKIAPELSFGKRMIFANQWLLSNVQKNQLLQHPITQYFFGTNLEINSLVQDSFSRSMSTLTLSSTAPFNGLEQWLNLQIQHPKIQLIGIEKKEQKPTRCAPTQNFAYRIIENTCKEVFPTLVSCPTINREAPLLEWQNRVDTDIYYFHPLVYDVEDFELNKQQIDDKISRQNYLKMLQFYYQLIHNII
jgi:carboxypeptidase PM20D1